MIKIKKRQLEALLLQLHATNGKGETLGLLSLELPLSFKRKTQRIFNDLAKHWEELEKDRKEIIEKKDLTQEQKQAEFDILLDEEVSVDQEKVKLSFLDNVTTKVNPDFELLELIGE